MLITHLTYFSLPTTVNSKFIQFADRSNSSMYSKYCGNWHTMLILYQLNSRLVTLYASTQFSNVLILNDQHHSLLLSKVSHEVYLNANSFLSECDRSVCLPIRTYPSEFMNAAMWEHYTPNIYNSLCAITITNFM
jgi:hypothetical protein